MPIPSICRDAQLDQFAAAFRGCFSRPQAQYFVTVLLALLCCLEVRTLVALQRTVCFGRSLAGLSRWFHTAPWQPATVTAAWATRFRTALAPAVAAEQARRRAARPCRPGRPRVTPVTGYLIGDDTVCAKARAHQTVRGANPERTPRLMAAIGQHYSSTVGTPVQGHCAVLTCYSLLGRCCPGDPALYRQASVCEHEKVAFQSKIDLMAAAIRRFMPLAGTRTHVLLDSWYAAKVLWKAARERDFLITTGLKSNRFLWVADGQTPRSGQWVQLSTYAAGLAVADWQAASWPDARGGHTIYIHVVRTRVRKLYTCQVVLVRESLDGPVKQVRYWGSSDLEAEVPELLAHIARRWRIEVLIADAKELGFDHYQMLSAAGVARWWTVVLAAYTYLEERQAAQQTSAGRHVTIEEMRAQVRREHRRHLLTWLFGQFQEGKQPEHLYDLLAA